MAMRRISASTELSSRAARRRANSLSARQVRFSDPDRSQNKDRVAGLGEPQRHQIRQHTSVVAEVVKSVPGVDSHRLIQPGLRRPQSRRA